MSDVCCLMSDVWHQTSGIRCHMSDIRCLMSDVTSDVRRLMSDDRRLMSYAWCLMFVWCHQMSDDRRLMSYVWYQSSDGRRLILDVRCKMTDVVCLKSDVWCQISDVRHPMSFLYKSFERHKNWNNFNFCAAFLEWGILLGLTTSPWFFFLVLIISSFNLSCHSHFRVSLL